MQPVLETFADTREQAARRLQRAFEKGQLTWVRTPYWNLDRGFHWVGAGDVQLTHRYNYDGAIRQAVLKVFGKDILEDPNWVMDPDISAYIMIEGMIMGDTGDSDFTRYSMEDYINNEKVDYNGARRSVNPGDKSSYSKIAAVAQKFEAALRSARGEINTTARYDGSFSSVVKKVQVELKALGYAEVGRPDGKWGTKTRGAVLAFRADNNMRLIAEIDEELLIALFAAQPRSVGEERAEATVTDLREQGSEEVEANDAVRRVAKTAVGVGATATAAEETGVLSSIKTLGENQKGVQTALDAFESVQGFVSENALLLIVAMGAYLLFRANRANNRQVAKHRAGEYTA